MKLNGQITHAGTLSIEGDQLIGVFVECKREDLAKQEIPLYKNVVIYQERAPTPNGLRAPFYRRLPEAPNAKSL
jgi:hypothetical protein